ncbi:MAG: cohesin domain-containing protein [Oscillospiraceae bacterium]|nr:cohesin domain-containing protein [Oscillospiraceae bacterium]
MRRFTAIITALVTLSVSVMLSLQGVSALSVSLTSDEAVRAGEMVTVTLSLNGATDAIGVEGRISYNPTHLSYENTRQLLISPWIMELDDTESGTITFKAYSNDEYHQRPLTAAAQILTVSFMVRAPIGTGIRINAQDIVLSYNSPREPSSAGAAAFTAAVTSALSDNANLQSLELAVGQLSPAFSPYAVSYNTTVPFDVEQLEIHCIAEDPDAQIAIDNPMLIANGVVIAKITVTAPSGVRRTYTIAAWRERDPNYVYDENNRLADIILDGGILSPRFNPDIDEYVVWLPFEHEMVDITAVTESELAGWRVSGNGRLIEGAVTPIQIIVKAESGDERSYTIYMNRAARGTGKPIPQEDEPEPADEPEDEDEPEILPIKSRGVPGVVLALTLILSLAGGGTVGFFYGMRRSEWNKKMSELTQRVKALLK